MEKRDEICVEPRATRGLQSLEMAISQPPVLGMDNFFEKYILQSDASGVALGAVLYQECKRVR